MKFRSIFPHVLILSVFSFYINYYYGFQGINPVDNFTNYNSGYNFLLNKYPFKDYWTATGPLLGLIQSFFFKVFGINWTAYVLHASFFNSILAISLFLFLLKFGVNRYISLAYSIFFSVIFYPPVGTPFVDHHSLFFTYISFFLIIFALNKNKDYFFLFLPMIFLLGFFSKQTPIAYFFIIISPVVIYNFKKINILNFIIIGSLISLLLFYVYLIITDTKIIDIYYQYYLTTSEVGSYRLKNSSFSFYNIFHRYRFIHASLILLLYFVIKSKSFNKTFKISKLQFIYLIVSLNFTLIFHQLLTMNQGFIFSIIFLNLGLCHKFIKYNDKKISKNIFLFSLIIFSTSICLKYHKKYNEPRRFNDLAYVDQSQAVNAGEYFTSLKNLKWFTNYNNNSREEIKNLKETFDVLNNEKKKYSLITDYQFLPIELKTYGNFSIKWYHSDVSFPNMNFPLSKTAELEFSNFFIEKLKNEKIEKIYFVPVDRGRVNLVSKIIQKKCKINKLEFTENLYAVMEINCI